MHNTNSISSSSKSQTNILIIGANGTMGKRIVNLLLHEIPQANLISGSRQRHNNPAPLAHRQIDLHNPDTYNVALSDVQILIHAAGPFDHDPKALVNYCIDHHIHYLDIAENLDFINTVVTTTQTHANINSCIIPGCSTAPGLVALLANRFIDYKNIAQLRIYLNMGSRNPVSTGLIFSLLRPLGRSLAHSHSTPLAFRHLVTRIHQDTKKRYYGPYPLPFTEGIPINQQVIPSVFFAGFDRFYINASLYFASWILPTLSDPLLKHISALSRPIAQICRLFGRNEGRLVIEAYDNHQNKLHEIEIIAKQNGLDIPATQVVWASKQLINLTTTPTGITPLIDLISLNEAKHWLTAQGYEVIGI